MSKITLTDLANLQNETTAVNAINTNNAVLETAMDNTLSRDGTLPNEMESNLDMNSNRIINLPEAENNDEPVRKAEFDLIANDYVGNNALVGTNNEISVNSAAGTTTFSLPTALTLTGKTMTGGTYSGANSYNKVAITAPATSATLTIANGTTLTTIGNTTLSGTNTGDVLSLPTGRLSLSSTSSLTTTDIAGATTLYYVDCGGGVVPIWDGSQWVMRTFTGSLSIALDSNPAHTLYQPAAQCFDVYAYWDSALGQIRLGITNIAQLDFSNRGSFITNIVLKNGIWVNTIDGFLRNNATGNVAGVDYIQPGVNKSTYLGSIGTVLAGQTEDSSSARLVFNAYNPRPRQATKKFTGAAYTYGTAAYRPVNNDATNQVETVLGLDGVLCLAQSSHNGIASVAPAAYATQVWDAITAAVLPGNVYGQSGRAMDVSGVFGCDFYWQGYPTLGRKFWRWMETGTGLGTFQWQPNGDLARNGMMITVSGM